jgi:hypothetical protein
LALRRKWARLALYQSEQLLPCFLLSLSIPSSLLSIARNTLALSFEDYPQDSLTRIELARARLIAQSKPYPESKAHTIQLSRALPIRNSLASVKSSARGFILSLYISGKLAKTYHAKSLF